MQGQTLAQVAQVVDEAIERCENCLAATEIPMRPELHVQGLKGCVSNVLAALKAIAGPLHSAAGTEASCD